MRFYVKTKPKARQTSVKKLDATHLLVSVTSIPSKGEANDAVIETLARHFKVAKSRVAIVSGGKSREKVVEIY